MSESEDRLYSIETKDGDKWVVVGAAPFRDLGMMVIRTMLHKNMTQAPVRLKEWVREEAKK